MKYVSVSQMQSIEKEANSLGLSYELMMQHAGQGLARRVEANYSYLKEKGVLGLVGTGNNGGDTLVALSWLEDNGWKASAYLINTREADDPLLQELIRRGGQVFCYENDRNFEKLADLIIHNAVMLDGILGTGFRLPLRERVALVLEKTKEFIFQSNPSLVVIAVDCPSGIDCDNGQTAQEVIPANLTITMAAVKQGLLKFPAYKYVGELAIVEIGLPDDKNQLDSWRAINRYIPERNTIRNYLVKRPLDGHKGTFGTAVIVAGSVNFPGAALLAGRAACRIGTGLVTLSVPETIQKSIIGHLPEATWIPLPEENGYLAPRGVKTLVENLERATALLVGPGFGVKPSTQAFMENLVTNYASKSTDEDIENEKPPLVIDADGLKILSKINNWWEKLPENSILTPHPGEMSVLANMSVMEIQKDRVKVAEEFSSLWNQVVVLKGAFTVIASPDGSTAIIPVATSALAHAGTGDVLAGFITGLRAQGINAFESAIAGAWIHANAGLLATNEIGNPASVVAGDIINSAIKIYSDLQ